MTLRYFGGMTVPEVAAALGVSIVTVETGLAAGAGLARRAAPRRRTNDAGTVESDRGAVRSRARHRARRATDLAPGDLGEDEALRDEVERLLGEDDRADRDGFLTPPEPDGARGSDRELAPRGRGAAVRRTRAIGAGAGRPMHATDSPPSR